MISCDVMPSAARASVSARAMPLDHRLERDAARGVGLRVEEDLGVTDAVGCGARAR